MSITEIMDVVARAFEAVGVLTLIVGGLHAFVVSWRERASGADFYPLMRQRFGLMLAVAVLMAVTATHDRARVPRETRLSRTTRPARAPLLPVASSGE